MASLAGDKRRASIERPRDHLVSRRTFREARDFNWHNVIGIWSAAPLFVIVLSGVVMSYPRANDLLYRIARNAPPAQGGGVRGESDESRAAVLVWTGICLALRRFVRWRGRTTAVASRVAGAYGLIAVRIRPPMN